MKLFYDISKFDCVDDYLPMLVAILTIETQVIFFSLRKMFYSPIVTKWYKTFKLTAVLTDSLIVLIELIGTRFLYHYLFNTFNIWKFIILALIVQNTHDFLFYYLVRIIPVHYNSMLDMLKKYGTETGIFSSIGNSIYIILTCLLASNFKNLSLNMNIISLILTLYGIPYLLYHNQP